MVDFMDFNYQGNQFETIKFRVSHKGLITSKEVVARELDESDQRTSELASYLRGRLPSGGACRIDAYGNLFVSGNIELELGFVPHWKKYVYEIENQKSESLEEMLRRFGYD